jgi:hypothetical protein
MATAARNIAGLHSLEEVATGNDAKGSEVPSKAFDFDMLSLPTDGRVRILGFLSVCDLANTAQVSRCLREDCDHPSLPQTRTVIVTCRSTSDTGSNSLESLLRKLLAMEKTGKFARFNRIKLVNPFLLDKLLMRNVRKIIRSVKLRHVTSLDLSVPYNPTQTALLRVIPKSLALLMPNLQDVDLSNTRFTAQFQSALFDFARNCPVLRKVVWTNHRTSAVVSGSNLGMCPDLKELCMDDLLLFFTADKSSIMVLSTEGYSAEAFTRCIFQQCNPKLERVSLKNVRYCSHKPGAVIQLLPQAVLVQFVRLTPNLRSFRSDLSPKNLALLRKERPEVTFM